MVCNQETTQIQTADEKVAAQASKIRQLCDQLASGSVKHRPSLPPLSFLEINKILERPQLTHWMRLM